ncbi:hypothetical protein [Desulfonatronospira sp.]|uniref:hypothetical protein n=1 Tax=Desulfonatronospira sp. TaxID=1962951 RepID=UPI0025BB5A6B|nr:hypothetical protein [Desulfonatronospira sp.]
MFSKRFFLPVAVAGLIFFSSGAMAHSPLFMCYEEPDGSILCEGAYSDGSSALETPIFVRGPGGELLQYGTLCEYGEIELEKPEGEFSILFDGGEGHQVELSGEDIR